MKCPFRIDTFHTSNGYNSINKYEYPECYEHECPFYEEQNNKGECKRTNTNNKELV